MPASRPALQIRPARRFACRVTRGVWASLAAIHLWPLGIVAARAVQEPAPSNVVAVAALAGVIALFSLKALDARFLRMHSPGVDLLVIAIAAALVHGDVIGRDGQAALAAETTTSLVAAVGGTSLASRRIRRRLIQFLRSLAAFARRARRSAPVCGTVALVAWPHPAGRIGCCALARAPPLSF